MAEHTQKVQFDRTFSMRLSQEHERKMIQKGIKPEHLRRFIEEYGGSERKTFRSHEWRELRDWLKLQPSLQLVGNIGSGKTYITRQLIEHDNNNIYIVLDAHNEYEHLPQIHAITPDLQNSCRLVMPEQPAGALGLFQVYYNMIMNRKFPANYILVIDEALRYKEAGIKNLLAETRKFLKCLAITQEILLETCPVSYVAPYKS